MIYGRVNGEKKKESVSAATYEHCFEPIAFFLSFILATIRDYLELCFAALSLLLFHLTFHLIF